MSNHPYKTQAEADLMNYNFQQKEELYCTPDEYYDYYAKRPAAEHYDDTAGIAPDRLKVAQELVEPILRGYVDANASLQEKKDIVWNTAKTAKPPINFAGFAEEWLDSEYVDAVFDLAARLISKVT